MFRVRVAEGEFDRPTTLQARSTRLRIPALELDAAVDALGIRGDSADEGKGAFFRLGTLEAGDAVTLTGPDGKNVPLGRSFASGTASRPSRWRSISPVMERHGSRDHLRRTATRRPGTAATTW
jgi:hypothetical protein